MPEGRGKLMDWFGRQKAPEDVILQYSMRAGGHRKYPIGRAGGGARCGSLWETRSTETLL